MQYASGVQLPLIKNEAQPKSHKSRNINKKEYEKTINSYFIYAYNGYCVLCTGR